MKGDHLQMRSIVLLALTTLSWSRVVFGDERCHSPPQAGPAHLLQLPLDNGNLNLSDDLRVLQMNLQRRKEGFGLRSVDSPISQRRSMAPAINYTYFPTIQYTSGGCRDSSGYACDYCCNGACCEKVVDVVGDADYNPPEVLNRTAGFFDISSTAKLFVPIRIVLIVRKGSTQHLSTDDIDDQLSVVNRYFATSRLRFFAHSFERIEDNAMSDSCRTDPCYADPTTCAFFRDTLPRFVKGEVSAIDVVNIFVCAQITYLGEAQFPWTSDEASPVNYVQIQFGAWMNKNPSAFYGLGMTVVHELGHYFGALHTFERDGVCDVDGDYVDDTVPVKSQASISEACDTLRNSCNAGYDDLANIMNYAADRCMRYFTAGQLLRMEQATIRYRQDFVRRHLIEAECPVGNNNLESCSCSDGSNIRTLCGVYAERIPITLFLPKSTRYNGNLYNTPDPLPDPIANDPLITPGWLIVFVLAILFSVSGGIGLLVLMYCWWVGEPAPPHSTNKTYAPWAFVISRGSSQPQLSSKPFPRKVGERDDTFSLHMSTQGERSQAAASRVAAPQEEDEYSDASGGGDILEDSPAIRASAPEEHDVDDDYAEEHEEEEGESGVGDEEHEEHDEHEEVPDSGEENGAGQEEELEEDGEGEENDDLEEQALDHEEEEENQSEEDAEGENEEIEEDMKHSDVVEEKEEGLEDEDDLR